MEDFERRMVIEYKELEERTDKLNAFLYYNENADKRKNVCPGQLKQMHRQLDAMKIYRDALSARLQMRGICFNGYDINELKRQEERCDKGNDRLLRQSTRGRKMSKAEKRASEWGYTTDPFNRAEYTADDVKEAFIRGYEEAEKDVTDKACGWLKTHINDYLVKGRDIDYMFDDFNKAMEEEQ